MTRMQYEQAKGAVQQGEGAVEAASSVARESRVTAPFAGRVSARLVEAGDLAAPGRPLVTVESATGRRLVVQVPAGTVAASGLSVGRKLAVRIDGVAADVTGTVVEMSPGADPGSHTYTATLELSGAPVATGLTGHAFLDTAARPSVLVPESAVLTSGGVSLVAVKDDAGRARTRVVTTGAVSGGKVEILSGLSGGETVLVGLAAPPADGAPVAEPKDGDEGKRPVSEPTPHGPSARELLHRKMTRRPLGASGRIAKAFLESKLTPLLVVASLLLGAFAILITPREEEPQIKVPMIDVFVALPGATAEEVERRVVSPVEKALYQIPNVEYVYSTSQPSGGIVIVRFLVGTDPDQAVVRVHAKLAELQPNLPRGRPAARRRPARDRRRSRRGVHALVEGRDADAAAADRRRGPERLHAPPARRAGDRAGRPAARRQRAFDRDRLASYGVSLVQAYGALSGLNWRLPAGSFASGNAEVPVEVGSLFRRAEDVGSARDRRRERQARVAEGRRDRLGRPRGALPVRVDAHEGRRRRARRDARRREEARHERRRAREGPGRAPRASEGARRPLQRDGHEDPRLRQDGGREVVRADLPRGARDALRRPPHGALPRPARGRRRPRRRPHDARAHALLVVPVRLHAEPRHALRAHLRDRHPRGRRDRRRRERPPPLRARLGRAAPHDRLRRGRGRQPDDPRDVRGRRGAPPARVRVGPHGPVHAPDSRERLGGDGLLAARRVRRLAVAHVPAVPQVRRGASQGRGPLQGRRRGSRRGPPPALLPAGSSRRS